MQAIKPLSAVSIALNSTNFPALQYAFVPDGFNAGTKIWTDSVAGKATGVISTGTINATLGCVTSNIGDYSFIAPAVPGTADALVIAVGSLGDNFAVGIGDVPGGAAQTFYVKTGGVTYTTVDGSGTIYTTDTTLGSVAVSSGDVTLIAKYADWSAESVRSVLIDASGSVTHTAAGAVTGGSITTGITALGNNTFRIKTDSGSEIYGIYLLYNTVGQLEDLLIGLEWMRSNPLGGLYPGWANIE